MNFPTPTRGGDWRVINGQLVDVTGLDLVTESAPLTPPATPDDEFVITFGDVLADAGKPPESAPAPKRRRTRKTPR